MPSTGIVNYLSGNSMNVGLLESIDELRISLSKFKLNYLLDYVDINDIYFDIMPSEQRNMISQICYSKNIYSVINSDLATVKAKSDGSGIRFDNPSDGYLTIIHAMLRKGLLELDPIEVAMGKYHYIASNFIYITLIRSFDKYYNIVGKDEKDLARIKYACACVTASKMFKITDDPNKFAEPIVSLDFKRIDPSYYMVDDAPSTYAKMAEYLNKTKVMEGINLGNLVEAFIRHLGSRSLVILESGIDFIIDTLLSKAVSRLIPRNLYKLVGEKNYQIINQYISASFNESKNSGRSIPKYMKPRELPKEGEFDSDLQEPAYMHNPYMNSDNLIDSDDAIEDTSETNDTSSRSNSGYYQHFYNKNYKPKTDQNTKPSENISNENTKNNNESIFNNLRNISSVRRRTKNNPNDNSGIDEIK